jgi:LysR family glycine cleavage system transcriptional activator
VRAAISEIAEGVESIRPGSAEQILTIGMVPCFAAYWLLPRLVDFNEQHPDIQVNIRAALSLTNFTRDGVDMAVRFGPGTWAGLISIKLHDEELIPVCSPAFRGGQLPRVPGDLLKVPLLHDERQPWSMWFEAVGLDYRDAGQGPRYSDQNLLYPAVIAGLGVALARSSLVERDLASGRLVRLFSRSVPTILVLHRVSAGLRDPPKNSSVPTVAARAGPIRRSRGCRRRSSRARRYGSGSAAGSPSRVRQRVSRELRQRGLRRFT